MAVSIRPMTGADLLEGTRTLARADPRLGRLVRTDGAPPLWARRPGFATLVQIILGQQVSLASADAAYRRLIAQVGRVTARNLARRPPRELARAGLTRQKARFCHHVASEVVHGRLDLRTLDTLSSDDAIARLTQVTGVGPWTARVYLMTALRRPDVWPQGDLAVYVAMREALGLDGDRDELDAHAECWRPWRGVAARILWRRYLRDRA